MKRLVLTVGLAAVLVAGGAQAETFIVQADGLNFSRSLVRQIENAGGQVSAVYSAIGVAVVESDSGFASRARRIRGIESATEDMVLQYEMPELVVEVNLTELANPPNTGDDDAFFDLQWGHGAIHTREAWNNGYRGDGVRVAILDSGIVCTHPDIAPNLNVGLSTSFVAGEPVCDVPPGFNHGTHVAGIVAAPDNALGTIGVAPEAELVAVKVLSAYTGTGGFAAIIGGIVYATDIDADVINMSLGVPGGLPIIPQTHRLTGAVVRAVSYANRHNTTVIASAGNDGINFDDERGGFLAFPGQVHGVIGITATAPFGWGVNPDTNLDVPASYTSHGKVVANFAAPGGDFDYAAFPCTVIGITRPCYIFDMVISPSGDSWYWAAGTSMAAPHATGVAALIIGANGGDLSPAAVLSAMTKGADDLGPRGIDPFFGRGRINADQSTSDSGSQSRKR